MMYIVPPNERTNLIFRYESTQQLECLGLALASVKVGAFRPNKLIWLFI